MLCPSQCGDTNLIANPPANCKVDIRQTTPSRFHYMGCENSLPSPLNDAAIQAMYADGLIVRTSRLANIIFEDPTFEDIMVDDCSPAYQVLQTRVVTFEDRHRVQLLTGSPSTVTNESYDYDFWLNKLQNQERLVVLVEYCNGDVKAALDADGNPLTMTMQNFLTYQKAQTQGGAAIEFKKGRMVFSGDPLGFTNKVLFNTVELGIN